MPVPESGGTDLFPRIEVSVPDDSGTHPLALSGAFTLEAWIKRDVDAVGFGDHEGIVGRYRQDQNGPARSYASLLRFDDGLVERQSGWHTRSRRCVKHVMARSNPPTATNSRRRIPIGEWLTRRGGV